MSISAPGPLGAPGPLSVGANPLGGATPFGFEIPQGDPGAITGAAQGARTLAAAMSEQGRALRAAASVAVGADGGWRGSASAAYAAYSGHVAAVFATGAAGAERAAGVLESLGHELAHAQQVTKQALADCGRLQGEVTTQNTNATTAGARASTLQAGADTALHPAARTALAHDAAAAGRAQQAAQTAARVAEGELNAAKRRGVTAYETYLHAAQRAGSELEAAAGDMRVAPSLPGGPAVPVTTSPGDVTLAATMLNAAGGIPAAANALNDPAELRALAGGRPVTPGVVTQFLTQLDERVQLAKLPSDNLDSSLAGVIPGPAGKVAEAVWKSPPGQFFHGAGNTVAGTVVLLANGVIHFRHDPSAIAHYVSNAWNHPGQWVRQTVDYNDFAHGRIALGAGTLFGAVVVAKGAGAGVDAATGGAGAVGDLIRNPENRPELTKLAGKAVALKVPHADNVAEVVAPVTDRTVSEVSAGVRAAPEQILHGILGTEPIRIQQLLPSMNELPPDPKVIVASHPPPAAYRSPPVISPRLSPRGMPRGR